jgi:predicted RNase H-like HicB family nuclease
MTRKYSIMMEKGPSGLSAYIPELPSILVTGRSVQELRARATEAIRIYWDEIRADRSPASIIDEVEVEGPA